MEGIGGGWGVHPHIYTQNYTQRHTHKQQEAHAMLFPPVALHIASFLPKKAKASAGFMITAVWACRLRGE